MGQKLCIFVIGGACGVLLTIGVYFVVEPKVEPKVFAASPIPSNEFLIKPPHVWEWDKKEGYGNHGR